MNFNYNEAFSRNIGWVTPNEQNILKSKRIAIAGLGGVGGAHLTTLTRLGVGAFNIADFDSFDLPNFNRQIGASMPSLAQDKTTVMQQQALAINPELQLTLYAQGVTEDNLKDFLSGVDLYVDSLDFFAVDIRRKIFAECARSGIPAITAAPLGMGCALLNFLPGQMTFEEYFRLEGQSEDEQLLRFLVGLSPARLQNSYLVYPQAVDIPNHKGPSTAMGVDLCAGIAATQTLKILLGRGKVLSAPRGLHFDAYKNKMVKTWRPGGNNHPIQKLSLVVARKLFGKPKTPKVDIYASTASDCVIEKILDAARWAPSGDNAQPWRFEITDDQRAIIRARDTREHVVYDLQGHASQIALGAMLETIAIAASQFGMGAHIVRQPDTAEGEYLFNLTLTQADSIQQSSLAPYIPLRTTQRRAMSTRRLSSQEKQTLEDSIPRGHRILWFETLQQKWRMTQLLLSNAQLRLTLPEAFPVHRDAIQWNAQFSQDRIPDQSLGIDPVTLKAMKWSMKSWERVNFMNKYLAGTLLPRIQLDLIPGMACGAHFVLLADKPPVAIEDYLAAGSALQTFWLTATKLGLNIQPQYTPIVFHEYSRDNIRFSATDKVQQKADSISAKLKAVLGHRHTDLAVYMGRIGAGPKAKSRSVRLPLTQLTGK